MFGYEIQNDWVVSKFMVKNASDTVRIKAPDTNELDFLVCGSAGL